MTQPVMAFRLPAGLTARKVANALAREWLPPFLVDSGPKAPRWVLQPVVEVPADSVAPLWEAGIATQEYEERLERTDLSWLIRASVARGRGKGTVLARLFTDATDPGTIQVAVSPSPLAETIFDPAKVERFLQARGLKGFEGLVASLLTGEGLVPANQ